MLKRSHWKLIRLLPGLGLAAVAIVFLSCDSTATIHQELVRFSEVLVVDVTPVKEVTTQDGSNHWVPSCLPNDVLPAATSDQRIRFNMVLKSSDRGNPNQTCAEKDCDRQIRPGEPISTGDVIFNEGSDSTIKVGDFEMALQCVSLNEGGEAAPAGCPSIANQQVAAPDASLIELDFVDHMVNSKGESQGRDAPVGVAILIDQSGSISGSTTDRDSCLEGEAGHVDPHTANFDICKSDAGDVRIAAAKTLLDLLNKDEKAIIFSFGEEETPNVKVACDVPNVDSQTEEYKLEKCYTTNRSYATEQNTPGLPSALDYLAGKGFGRSNLWTAIDTVWDYMLEKDEIARHLVVITDGPDTCKSDSSDFQKCFNTDVNGVPESQGSCSATSGYEAIRDKITAYSAQKFKQRGDTDMHVSFIQFQAPAYPAIDPRMQEIACMTNGHHTFVNMNDLSKENIGLRKTALENHAEAIRYTFGGFWNLVTDINALTGLTSEDAVVSKGGTYSIKGYLSLGATQFKPGTDTADFSTGTGNLDTRVHLTRPCDTATDCGAGAGAECGVGCDEQTHTCRMPAASTKCQGDTGTCCTGQCKAGETFCLDNNPNPPPKAITPVSFCP